ncbi:MAG: TetR family transcriptional regulator [Alcanivorax sp.]|nr:TetR family transcriptional regulator [Alcanivorax sp.]
MARPQQFNAAEALRQAMDAFWKKGYEATSLTDLLSATGLSKSSLYATFGGKHELFVAAFDAYREERTRRMEQVLAQSPGRLAVERFFREIATDTEDGAPSRGCMSINQAVEMAPRDAGIRARVLQDFQRMEDALTQTIERGQTDGSIARGHPARELARLLVLAFPGLQVMVRAGADHEQLDNTLNGLLALLD